MAEGHAYENVATRSFRPVNIEHIVRRRTLLLQVITLAYSLTFGAFRSNPPLIMEEPEGLARLGIAVTAGVLGMWVRDRMQRKTERSGTSTVVDVIVVYGFIFVSQELLGILSPALTLNWAPTQGGYVGFMLFAATRALFAGQANPREDDPGSESLEGLSERGRLYRSAYRVGASVTLVIALAAGFAGGHRAQLAAALVVAGSSYLLWQTLFDKRLNHAVPRLRLAGQIETMRRATLWYYFALLPAALLALFGSVIYLYWLPIVILIFAEANQRTEASLNAGLCSLTPDSPARTPASPA